MFYLNTPLNRPGYVKIWLAEITQEFMDEYDLETWTQEGRIYPEIRKGVYGITQTGKIENDLLHKQLSTAGYYEVSTTPDLWLHKWHPILFSLIVDNFGIDYVEERHAKHLLATLKEHYTITTD